MAGFTPRYRTEIQQMMFVSGETGEPSQEVTTMIEQIVQGQVHQMLRECTLLANRGNTRSISTDHIMGLIRDDKAKVARLRHFLQWKDVRKNVKDSDDKGGGGGDAADLAATGGGDDGLLSGAAGVAAGPSGGGGPVADVAKKSSNKKARVDLSWDVPSFFSESVPARDDEEDEDEEEMNYATLQRLKHADERTKDMTREEYVHWSDCRQASFTFRKGKRFREWAGFGVITDAKPNDDIIDILGFLTFEIVQSLTEEALRVKSAEDASRKSTGSGGAADDKLANARKRKRETGLFDPPEEAREPVQPRHVQEGFRRTQRQLRKARAMLNLTRGITRSRLTYI